jgi:glycyl-tRNA synthetase (class II)
MNEVKGIQDTLIKMIDAQFNNAPTNITQIVKSQTNEITLKEWMMRIPSANSMNEVESIITTKENG